MHDTKVDGYYYFGMPVNPRICILGIWILEWAKTHAKYSIVDRTSLIHRPNEIKSNEINSKLGIHNAGCWQRMQV